MVERQRRLLIKLVHICLLLLEPQKPLLQGKTVIHEFPSIVGKPPTSLKGNWHTTTNGDDEVFVVVLELRLLCQSGSRTGHQCGLIVHEGVGVLRGEV